MLLFLLLGAIINVAVAWGFGITAEFHRENVTAKDSDDAHRLWRRLAPAHWPDVPSETYVVRDTGVLKVGMYHPVDRTEETVYRFDWYKSGWPAYSMQGRKIIQFDPAGGFVRGRSVLLFFDAPVNLLPRWPGFATNTVFYSAILWLIFAGPFELRRWSRNKRGLCPKCAYPIGTSHICTECGRPIPGVKRRTNDGP